MSAARRLRVDWPACKASGVCAEVLPALVRLDEWGYPVIAVKPVPDAMSKQAERAVVECPTQALRLVEVPQLASSRRERRQLEGEA
jgi:ferredoxin